VGHLHTAVFYALVIEEVSHLRKDLVWLLCDFSLISVVHLLLIVFDKGQDLAILVVCGALVLELGVIGDVVQLEITANLASVMLSSIRLFLLLLIPQSSCVDSLGYLLIIGRVHQGPWMTHQICNCWSEMRLGLHHHADQLA